MKNIGFKQYCALALGVLTLDVASAQMCPGDHGKLTHNTEFNVHVTCAPGDPDTYLGFEVAESDNAGPYSGHYAGGWCIDVDRYIYCNQDFSVDSYSSYDYDIPDDAIDQPGNLTRVNWLINNHPIESTVELEGCYNGVLGYEEYQEAVWTLLDHKGALDLGAQDCIVDWLVEQAMLYGDGYQVSCENSEKIGVIFVVDNSANEITHQVVMAEIPIAEIDELCDCGDDAYVLGDPHFKTWSGELYDFHGVCDLALIQNPQFMNGLGMDINVRAKKMKQFSFISTAVIRIGSETFEVAAHKDGDTYWLNGEQGGSDGVLKEGAAIAGYSITFRQVHSHQREYVIHLSEEQKIAFVTWKDFVRIDIKGARSDNFQGSLGLMGSFNQGGAKLGRDGVTIFDDVNEFGMEWQVLSSEAKLFHQDDGPQHPAMCELPTKMSLRRRLAESLITQEEAEIACSRVQGEQRDLCVFDVMATNSKDVAGAY